jgi:hypothetical protein
MEAGLELIDTEPSAPGHIELTGTAALSLAVLLLVRFFVRMFCMCSVDLQE